MNKNFHSMRKRPLSFPIAMLCIILFLMYTIIDTAIRYDNISLLAAIISVAGCIAAILCIIRFSFVKYEFIIVGDELVIRRYTMHRVELLSSHPLSTIRAIDQNRLFLHKARRAKRYNLTNSLHETFFSSQVMTYVDFQSGEIMSVLISPTEDVRRMLKLYLEEKYRDNKNK